MNHDSYTDDYIAGILGDHKRFAFVGASANSSRPSYFAMKYLTSKGYTVIPVNPSIAGQEILGHKVDAHRSDAPGPIEVIDIFRQEDAVLGAVREAINLKDKLGLKVIWLQLGARNDQAAEEAEAAGLKVVMNRCPKIEYGRLSGEMGWTGVNSRTLSSARGKLASKGVQSRLLGIRK